MIVFTELGEQLLSSGEIAAFKCCNCVFKCYFFGADYCHFSAVFIVAKSFEQNERLFEIALRKQFLRFFVIFAVAANKSGSEEVGALSNEVTVTTLKSSSSGGCK